MGTDIYFWTVVSGIFGLVIGSFLNVVIWRVPNNESILGPSHCPKCEAPITAIQNIPLLSWLFLRGKCANCKNPISIRYPIVELMNGILFSVITWFFYPKSLSELFILLALLFFGAMSIVIAWIDADTMKIPSKLIYLSYIIVGILFVTATIISGNYYLLLNAFIGAIILGIVYFILFLMPKGPMGFGDVRLSLLIGFILGWFNLGSIFVGFILAFLLATIYYVPKMVINKSSMKGKKVPFGPWIIGGFWLAVFFGGQILKAYLRFSGIS